ncbi:hypothetical protein [Amphritea sp.]|uniref:PepSY domain-containing protein n=1 Tax=Amphritea sp. TaxID=1872502 RepID=UPI0025C14B8B|nr:hypothetical protein [Amphritea sp.]
MKVIFTTVFLAFFSFVTPVHSVGSGIKALDYEACRLLVNEGEILSMSELMKLVNTLSEGKIIDTRLLQDEQSYIYEMEIAGTDGMVQMLYVDARSGMVIDPVKVESE